jgi:putative transposase
MGRKARPVELKVEEQQELISITKKGRHRSRKIVRARALLSMCAGKDRKAVMEELGIDEAHYYRIKGRFLSGGLSYALEEKRRSGQPRKVTESVEAQITAISCSEAPAGASRWTLSLIRDKLVELKCEQVLSCECIRLVLKKVNSSPG